MQADFPDNDAGLAQMVEALSKPRLTRYLQHSAGDTLLALRLYHWNAQLCQALYLPLQTWEILLRNRLASFLAFKYGSSWPEDRRAARNFNHHDRRRIEESVRRLAGRNGSKPTIDQVVADLSAGFWVSQLGRDYQSHYGWRHNLPNRIFINDHSITRDDADPACNDLLELRNRVAHHEPIFHMPLNDLRRDLDWLIEGMCGITAAHLSSACSFSAIWAAKPI